MQKYVLVCALFLSSAASAADISVNRITLLNEFGEPARSLPAQITVSIEATADLSGTTCLLRWEGFSPTSHEMWSTEVLRDPLPPESIVISHVETVRGTAVLSYTGRLTPSGMAVGNAAYEGDLSDVILEGHTCGPEGDLGIYDFRDASLGLLFSRYIYGYDVENTQVQLSDPRVLGVVH